MHSINNDKNCKSGFISIIGRPNAGKSTLLNSILSKKISIVSKKPQTTRNRITGIKNINGNQLIFLDTPGIHRVDSGHSQNELTPPLIPPRGITPPLIGGNKGGVKKARLKKQGLIRLEYKAKSKLNKFMVETAIRTYNAVDLILALVDSDEKSGIHNDFIIKTLEKVSTPIFLIINKIDLIKKEKLLPLIDHYQKIGLRLKPDKGLWQEIIPISALHYENIDLLLNKIIKVLPIGPHYFPDNVSTGQPEKFIVSEFIREKAINITRQEIPYSLAVLVENIQEGKKGVMVIDALIYIERDSQKGIVIGKNGCLLKEIGKKARADIENWFGTKVYLNLYVKVKKDWTNSKRSLKELGYF